MSHNTINLDIALNRPIVIRAANDYTLNFAYNNPDATDFDATGWSFETIVFEKHGDPDVLADQVHVYAGLTIDIDKAHFPKSKQYRYEHRATTPEGKMLTFYAAPWYVEDGSGTGGDTSTVTATINTGDQVIEGTFQVVVNNSDITEGAFTDAQYAGLISEEPFSDQEYSML